MESQSLQEKRLRSRQTETEESLQRRLNIAKHDMEYGTVPNFIVYQVILLLNTQVQYNVLTTFANWTTFSAEKPDSYDFILVNDDLEKSYEKLKAIINKVDSYPQ